MGAIHNQQAEARIIAEGLTANRVDMGPVRHVGPDPEADPK